MELLSGVLGEALLVVPMGLMGRWGGEDAYGLICARGCNTPYTGQKLGAIGAMSGVLLGAGLAVSSSGSLLGGKGLAAVSMAGAMAGCSLGSGLMFVFGNPRHNYLLFLMPAMGALGGALLAYELSDSMMIASPETGAQWGTVPRIGAQLLVGAAGAAVMMAPLMFQGGWLGSRISNPSCSFGFCFDLTHAEKGAFFGAVLGVAVGTGLGITWAGSSLGGHGHWLVTLGGAAAGTAIGVGFKLRFKEKNPLIALPPAGALLGGILAYELSNAVKGSSPEATDATAMRVAPSLAPLPGGGMVGAVGRF